MSTTPLRTGNWSTQIRKFNITHNIVYKYSNVVLPINKNRYRFPRYLAYLHQPEDIPILHLKILQKKTTLLIRYATLEYHWPDIVTSIVS